MHDYSAMIRGIFEQGFERDADTFFEALIQNAFPTFHFRNLAVTRIQREEKRMEGKSQNHVFDVHFTELSGQPVWEVNCHRVTMGKTPDKQVYLNYLDLGFVSYKED